MKTHLKINKHFSFCNPLLQNIKTYFAQNSQTIHKARNELKVIEYKGIQTVVKAFKIPNLLNRIMYAYFRDSKAKKSYNNALTLLSLGINTPQPIGYIEFYKNLLFQESFFISKKQEYEFTIRTPLRDLYFPDREKIIKAFVRFTYDLHQKGVYHKDFSAGNILVIKNGQEYNFSIVDINRMQFKSVDYTMGLDNFAKLWLDENSLVLIAKEYAKLAGIKEEEAVNILQKSDKKLKGFVALKKKIRGKA